MPSWALYVALTVQDVAPYLTEPVTLTDPAGWTQEGVLIGLTETGAILEKEDGRQVTVPLAGYTSVRGGNAAAPPPLAVEALSPQRFLVAGHPVGWEKAAYSLSTNPYAAPYVVSADRRTTAGKAALGLGAALLIGGVVAGSLESCLYSPGMPVYCYNRWDIGGPLVAGGVVVSGSGAALLTSGLRQRMRAAEALQERE